MRALALLGTIAMSIAIGASARGDGESDKAPAVVERVTVRLAQVSIVATDRKGRPITDLKAEEILVRDGREQREVVYLEPLTPIAPAPGPTAVGELYVDLPGIAPRTTRPGVDAKRYVAFLIDTENDDPLTRGLALETLVDYLRQQTPPPMAAVFAYDGEVHLESTFTSDVDALSSALQRAWDRHGRARLDLRARIDQLIDGFGDCVTSGGEFSQVTGSDRCIETVASLYAEETRPYADRYYDGLADLVRILAGLDGHTTVVALSHGVAADPVPEVIEAARAVFGTTELLSRVQIQVGPGGRSRVKLNRLIQLAQQNDVLLNFVDRSRAPTGDGSARRGKMMQPGARPMTVAFTSAQEDIREVATATGGRLFATSDLKSALGQVGQADRGTYELGYYVDAETAQARLERVSIDATRKGVRLNHRRARFAKPATRTLPGRIVLAAPTAGRVAGRTRYNFSIEADPRSLGYRVVEEQAIASFTAHVVIVGDGGQRVADAFSFFTHSYDRALWEEKTNEPLTFEGWAELPAGAYHLELALRNVDTQDGGVLQTAFVIEPALP